MGFRPQIADMRSGQRVRCPQKAQESGCPERHVAVYDYARISEGLQWADDTKEASSARVVVVPVMSPRCIDLARIVGDRWQQSRERACYCACISKVEEDFQGA